MKHIVVASFLVAAMPALVLASVPMDRLKCERVRDPLRVKANIDLLAAHPELSAADCKVSKPKLFCSPATETGHRPSPPSPGIVGQSLANDYVCYKAQCPSVSGIRTITDEFGTREQRQTRTELVCVPAAGGCAPMTCADEGANCGTIANGCGGTLQCGTCIFPDTCGGGGQSNVCGTPSPPGVCATTTPPSTEPLGSTCRLPFPPVAGIPCPVVESGPVYYVNAATGSDSNDGATPARAWASLCRAIEATPSGSTIRVAEGTYITATLDLNKAIVVKGGFDASFATWDPDRHHTVFTGALTMRHDGAVFGGFRMIGRPVGQAGGSPWGDWHHVEAGLLVRNYVEIVYQASPDQHWFYAILASARQGHSSRIRCNDVYVRGTEGNGGFLLVDGIEYGNLAAHLGTSELSDNRICLDGPSSGWANTVVSGYGTCGPTPTSIIMANNVMENAVADGISDAMGFYGCQSNLDLVLTNNTIVSAGDGLTGYENPPGIVRWTLTNNVIVGTNGRGVGVNVGSGAVRIPVSQGNLVFGFADNAIRPTPFATTGDSTGGGWTASQVFVAPSVGDFRPRTGGPAIDTGANVYGQSSYGGVTSDLEQRPRPSSGPWERGAFEQ